MKSIITNNVLSANYLVIPAKGLINSIAVLRDIRPIYRIDNDGNRTEDVVGFRYECIDSVNFSTFTVRVDNSKPIITSQELEASTEVVYVDIPLEATVVKPYEISYGNAKISIIASSIKLHK